MTKLAQQYSVEIPVAATLFTIVFRLIKKFLPLCTDDECLQHTRHRIALGMKQDNWSDEVMACDEATSVLEKSDADAMKAEKKRKLQKPRRISETSRRNSDTQQPSTTRQGPKHRSSKGRNRKSKKI